MSDVIHELLNEDLLSNARFTEAFVHCRVERGSGPRKIIMELRERGVDDGLIETCLDGYEGRWANAIKMVREKKYGANLPQNFKERSRQTRFLQQRGFTPEQISSVFKYQE